MGTPRVKSESLEQLIRRVRQDAADVGAPMTAQILAQAIRSAGWSHPFASDGRLAQVIGMQWTSTPHAIAQDLAERGWKHPRARALTRADQ